MADQDRERLLAAFADHLLKNRLADEKHGRSVLTEDTLQSFISHLATRSHVAANTQNQAFGGDPLPVPRCAGT